MSGIVYGYTIPNNNAGTYQYVGETHVRHAERNYQHAYTDKSSAVYKHSHANNYIADPSFFTILAKGYHKWLDRKICEALYIKDHKPFLNKQKN